MSLVEHMEGTTVGRHYLSIHRTDTSCRHMQRRLLNLVVGSNPAQAEEAQRLFSLRPCGENLAASMLSNKHMAESGERQLASGSSLSACRFASLLNESRLISLSSAGSCSRPNDGFVLSVRSLNPRGYGSVLLR